VPAEHEVEELARQLVVLLVCSLRFDRNRALAQLLDEPHQVRLLRFRVTLVLLAQPRGEQAADAGADQRVGQRVGLEELEGEGSHGKGIGIGDRGQQEGGGVRRAAERRGDVKTWNDGEGAALALTVPVPYPCPLVESVASDSGASAGKRASCSSTYTAIAMLPSSMIATNQPIAGCGTSLLVEHPRIERQEAEIGVGKPWHRSTSGQARLEPTHSQSRLVQAGRRVTASIAARMPPNRMKSVVRGDMRAGSPRPRPGFVHAAVGRPDSAARTGPTISVS